MNLSEPENKRWSLTKQIIDNWWPPLKPDDGFGMQEILEAEKKLQLKLPAAMIEWYLLAGKRKDLINSIDIFFSPDELKIQQGILEFCIEAQSVYRWGIKLLDLHMTNPPVFATDNDYSIESYRIGSFSLFVTNLLTFITLVSQPGLKAEFTLSTGESDKFLFNFTFLGYAEAWPLDEDQLFSNENGIIIKNKLTQKSTFYAPDIKKFESGANQLGVAMGKPRNVKGLYL